MRWLVTYRAPLHQWSSKGKKLAHEIEHVDYTAVVSVDLDKWIEGRRPNLHEFRTNPQENKTAFELLEIIALIPLGRLASEERRDLIGVFGIMAEMPGLRLEH
jgi:hypothetical protein